MTKPGDDQRDPAAATTADNEPEAIQDLQVTGGDADAVSGGGGLGGESADDKHKE
jgi:hypothetical protein